MYIRGLHPSCYFGPEVGKNNFFKWIFQIKHAHTYCTAFEIDLEDSTFVSVYIERFHTSFNLIIICSLRRWCENHTNLCRFHRDASKHRVHFHSAIMKLHFYRSENWQLFNKSHKAKLYFYSCIMVWCEIILPHFYSWIWAEQAEKGCELHSHQAKHPTRFAHAILDLSHLGHFPSVSIPEWQMIRRRNQCYEMQMFHKEEKFTFNLTIKQVFGGQT